MFDIRHGNKFLYSVEVCAQEAAYLMLQLHMFKRSREVAFINTGPERERTTLLKKKEDLEK